jgi:hypothetical protein
MQSTTPIIKRLCPSCSSDFQETYYRRHTPLGGANPYDLMCCNWLYVTRSIVCHGGLTNQIRVCRLTVCLLATARPTTPTTSILISTAP